jgi:hypothetical protein
MNTSTVKSDAQPESPPILQNDQTVPASTFERPTVEQTSSQTGSPSIAGLDHIEDERLISARRLIVLVPDWDVDEAEFARQVWEMALLPGLAVLFFGLCKDITEEPGMHRRLATLAALTRDPRLPVETQLEVGHHWLRKLKGILAAGDILVYPSEEKARAWNVPLHRSLSKLKLPVWTLKGFDPPVKTSASAQIKEFIFWIVSVVIVIAFFWLQVSIVRMSEDWAHSALIYLCVLAEVGLLWIWHSVSL